MNQKLATGILAIAMMAVPGIAATQDNQGSTDESTHTMTGCLAKSRTANIYLLTDEDGKLWDLRSKTVPLRSHVGQIVTVTGTIPVQPKGSVSPANTSPENHLLVATLKMVQNNCNQQ